MKLMNRIRVLLGREPQGKIWDEYRRAKEILPKSSRQTNPEETLLIIYREASTFDGSEYESWYHNHLKDINDNNERRYRFVLNRIKETAGEIFLDISKHTANDEISEELYLKILDEDDVDQTLKHTEDLVDRLNALKTQGEETCGNG